MVVAVVPYVPSDRVAPPPPRHARVRGRRPLRRRPRTAPTCLQRVVRDAPGFLRPGGALLLELGGDQAELLRPLLGHLGYTSVRTWSDEDGDLRGLEATLG